jgi:hypothetical protein
MTKKSVEANNQRIVQAVRRIARTAIEEDGRLSPANKKAAIGKTRGVAFYNSNGDIESNSGELPDEASTETPDDSGSQTKERNYKTITDDLEEGDKADEFEGYDCATGDKIQLDLAPMPGQEYQAPTGWDDANTPPVDPTYEAGIYWKYGSAAGLPSFSTRSSAMSAGAENAEDGAPPVGAPDNYKWSGDWVLVGDGGAGSGNGINWTNRFMYERDYYWVPNPSYGGTYTYNILMIECGGSAASYCNPSPEDILLETEWPSDDITSLAVINGKFTASQYDPDAADGYKNNPPSRIEMCDGLGNRYEINALSNGNTMITKLQTDGSVDVLGQSLIINTSGVVKEKISNYTRDGLL